MIPVPVNLPDIHAEVPVQRSCNCCDYVVCTFSSACCGKRAKSPTPPKEEDNKIKSIARQVMDEKQMEKKSGQKD
jgi:hypothetical protein